MALTTVLVKDLGPVGNAYGAIVDITGDAAYATGGEALAVADLAAMMPKHSHGLAATDADKIQTFQSEVGTTGHYCRLDRANDKVLFYDHDSEVANLADLSAVTVRALVLYGAVT